VWPYYVKPRTYWPGEGSDPLQNTDPFVFADTGDIGGQVTRCRACFG
jgi:hypothetical protein